MVHVERLCHREIAARYGVDGSAVGHWLRKFKIAKPDVQANARRKIRRPRPSPDELRRLYVEEDVPLREIEQMTGFGCGTLVRWCREAGIEIKRDGFQNGRWVACSDGHLVRSSYERRVDDWLHAHGIEHVNEPRVPFDRRCRADFLANGWFIEIWGVHSNKSYSAKMAWKRKMYREHGLPLIEVGIHAFATARNSQWTRRLQTCLNPPTS